MIDSVLDGNASAARDIVLLNAGAGIYVSGIAASLAEGIKLAANSVDSGKAKAVKAAYVSATNTVN